MSDNLTGGGFRGDRAQLTSLRSKSITIASAVGEFAHDEADSDHSARRKLDQRPGRRADNLEVALKSSRQIGTAMGILMARRLVTSEQAFELLNRASQHLNRKLRDIAEEVELTGTLPNLPETAG